MASDVAGPVRVSARPDQPHLGAAVLVAGASTALVAGVAVLAVGTLVSPGPATVRLEGSGSTEAVPALLPGQDGEAYLVLRNATGDRVRITQVLPGAATVRPGSAAGCDPAALQVRVGSTGLEVGPGQTAMVTAHLHLDAVAGEPCRGAVFDLPVTALARPA